MRIVGSFIVAFIHFLKLKLVLEFSFLLLLFSGDFHQAVSDINNDNSALRCFSMANSP